MFRKLLFFVVLAVVGYATSSYISRSSAPNVSRTVSVTPQTEKEDPSSNQAPDAPVTTKTRSLFVPYWSDLDAAPEQDYDRYIYFGIGVTEQGINTEDVGYSSIPSFIEFAGTNEKWVTIRMINQDVNSAVLEDPDTWPVIAQDIARLVEQYNFDGVVLDLEVGLVAFHINPESITGFTTTVSKALNDNNVPFAFAIYGDTYFRGRPYDVEAIANQVDEVMIMAYDFHKSFGTPGPNFPLRGREQYDYDYQSMLRDFTADVPAEKLSIIVGMYGYEWIVDSQERPLKAATAITLNQAQNSLVPTCKKQNCKVERDGESAETKVTFTGEEGRPHVVWFEDEESARLKEEYSNTKGIGNIVYWAFGYF